MNKEEIRQKYEKMARWYDLGEGIAEVLGIRRLRKRLLLRASGKVLEIAVGTGKNLPYYLKGCQITGVDISQTMLEIARRRADRIGLKIAFRVMDGEALAFPDQHFDTVVSSPPYAPFPIQRLRSGKWPGYAGEGRILLLEHGRSDREWLGRWQDRKADRHAERLGCHWNRKPLDLVRQAGLKLLSARCTFFGVFHEIEATPSGMATGDVL